MSSSDRQNRPDLIAHLLASPEAFEFLQAMMLLRAEQARAAANATAGSSAPAAENGFFPNPVRVIANASLAYPATEVARSAHDVADDHIDPQAACRSLAINFLGMHGPSGALPAYVTQAIATLGRGVALTQVLDTFNDHLARGFLRVADASSVPRLVSQDSAGADPITIFLLHQAGVESTPSGSRGERSRLQETSIVRYYGAAWRSRPMALTALQAMLRDLLELPVRVVPFQPFWTNVDVESRMTLRCASDAPSASRSFAGVLGRRTRQGQWGVTIRVGPVDLRTFCRYLPGTRLLGRVATLVAAALGPWTDFIIQPVLRKDQIRPWILRGTRRGPRRTSPDGVEDTSIRRAVLGRTMFLLRKPLPGEPLTPRQEDFDQLKIMSSAIRGTVKSRRRRVPSATSETDETSMFHGVA